MGFWPILEDVSEWVVGRVIGYARHSVHEMWSFALVEIPVLEDLGETSLPRSAHAFVVDSDRDDIESAGSHRLNRIHICKFLAQDTFFLSYPVPFFIPDVTQCLNCLREPICATTGEYDLWALGVGDVGVEVLARELAEEGV